MASALHFGFAAWVSLVRREIRKQWGIPRGDFLTDFMWSVVAWFFVLTQCEVQMREDKINLKKIDPEVRPEQPAILVASDTQQPKEAIAESDI